MSTIKVKELVKSFHKLSAKEKRAFIAEALSAKAMTHRKKGKILFYWALTFPEIETYPGDALSETEPPQTAP